MPKEHKYPGEKITVTYDRQRCIHAAECLRRLPDVFEMGKKPWVEPDKAAADEVAETVMRCPSGALHFAQPDGITETPPETNSVTVTRNGPLYVHGDIELRTPDGETVLRDTRIALCRCGKSSNNPFCDDSHIAQRFRDPGQMGTGPTTVQPESPDKALVITLRENGSLGCAGPVEIRSADGQTLRLQKVSLCRCGGSSNKPFCDGTHKTNGFRS